MQMIDVLKRLQELDANNPNIVKEDDANSKMIADLQKISAPSIDQFVDNDKPALDAFDKNMENFYAKYSQNPLVLQAANDIRNKMSTPGYDAGNMVEYYHGFRHHLLNLLGVKQEPYQSPGKAMWAATINKSREAVPQKTELAPKQETLESLEECGMMGDMNKPHSPATINMTADSGEELAHMLKDIMSLAGMHKVEPGELGIEPEPAVMRADPSLGKASDNSDMRRMLDTLNDQEVTEMDNEPTDEIMGDMEDDALLSGKHARPGGEPGAAEGRAAFNNPHAYAKESATYESLMADYRKFVSESEEQQNEAENVDHEQLGSQKLPIDPNDPNAVRDAETLAKLLYKDFPNLKSEGAILLQARDMIAAKLDFSTALSLTKDNEDFRHELISNYKKLQPVSTKSSDQEPDVADWEDLRPDEFSQLRALHQKLSARGNRPARDGGFDPTKP